jgi:hypothetical protein
MRRILIFLILLAIWSFDSPRLIRVKVTDDISMLLPKEFRPMDELDLSQRFPSVRKPLAAYTNYERDVAVSVNISATQWPDADVAVAKKFFKTSVLNAFDNVDLIDEGIHEIRNKKLIYFEFESRIKGNPRELGQQDAILNYSYVQYLVEPDRTLVFSFHCPRRLRKDWQDIAHKMMSSIKLK